MADKTVVVRLRAVVSEYQAAMTKAATATDGVTKKSSDFSKLGAETAKLGGQLTRNVTLPLVAVGAASAKFGYDFEQTFARMQGLAGVPAGEIDALKESVLGLAGETARSPQDLAEGLYFIESAGIHGKTALDALDVSARAATAGLGDTAAVADAVTSAINAYGEANITAAEAGDVLAATAREGKAEASELAPQFGRLLPIAAELGVEFHEVGAGMAFLSRSSGDAALSATQLGGVLNKILEPGQEGAEALEAIGSSADALRKSVDEEGLLPALTSLRDNLEANGLSLNDFSKDQQFLQGALQLTGAGASDAADVFASLEASSGSLGRAFSAVAETDGFKMKQAMVEVQVALTQIGGVILPLAGQVASFGASAVSVFTALPGPITQVAIGFGAILAATGPLMSVGGTLAKNWKAIASVLETAGIKAMYAKDNLGKLAGGAGLTAVVVFGLNKAIQDHAAAMENARRIGREWAEVIKGDDFDATRVSVMGLDQEIQRLSGQADAFDGVSGGLSIVNEIAKTTQSELDGTIAPLVELRTNAAHLSETLGISAEEALHLARDTDFMAASTDAATGEINDEAAAHELVVQGIQAQADALKALYDPLFAAQSASNALADAQAAVMDAAIKNSDSIDDNNVSAAEMVRLNAEATRAAVGYQGALLSLKAGIEDGSVSIDDSIATLQGWVDQGLITQQQADEAAYSISVMGTRADEVNGKNIVVHADLDATQMFHDLARLAVALNDIPGHVRVSVGGGGGATLASGGLVEAGGVGVPGRAVGTDTVPAMLTPGEFVLTRSAVQRLGIPHLNALNGGGPTGSAHATVLPMFSPSAGGGTTTIVNHYEINASSLNEQHLARAIRDAVVSGGKRGIRPAA